jgi:hypothetical protein
MRDGKLEAMRGVVPNLVSRILEPQESAKSSVCVGENAAFWSSPDPQAGRSCAFWQQAKMKEGIWRRKTESRELIHSPQGLGSTKSPVGVGWKVAFWNG